MGRKAIGAWLRLSVMQRDKFSCVYCGARGSDAELHIDHRIPVAKGGSNNISNLVTSCAACNLGKSDREDPRADDAALRVGDVVAIGLASGECPVGKVSSVGGDFVKLDAMSFLTGEFGFRTYLIPLRDVSLVVRAELMGSEQKASEGWDESIVIWDTQPLGDFQTRWVRDHRRPTGGA